MGGGILVCCGEDMEGAIFGGRPTYQYLFKDK
ncbi:hypothetical protein ACFLTL_02245 [Chloroflexota bacterium]